MDRNVDPPAIVKPAEADEKWDLDVKAAIGLAMSGGKRIVLAGAAMLKAKMACPPGLWLKTLAKHGVTRRTASRWIDTFRQFPVWANVAHANQLADSLGVTSEEEQEIAEREAGDEDVEHPALKIILCKDCRRKGAARDCKKCIDERLKFLGKGGGGRGSKSSSKAGKVKFDWQKFSTHLPAVYQFPDRIAKAFPELAGTPDLREAAKLLDQLAELVKKIRLTSRGEDA